MLSPSGHAQGHASCHVAHVSARLVRPCTAECRDSKEGGEEAAEDGWNNSPDDGRCRGVCDVKGLKCVAAGVDPP